MPRLGQRADRRELWMSKVDTSGGSDACWPWTGATQHGYGIFWRYREDGKTQRNVKAHRAGWEFLRGPIPNGLQVLHRCDNRPCCNPSHHFLGTPRDNIHDMLAKGRQKRSDYTVDEVADMRRMRASGETYEQIGIVYGLSVSQTWNLINGKCAARAMQEAI